MHHFFFDVLPVPKGRPRFDRRSGIAFTPAKTRNAEAELRWLIRQAWNKEPLTGALSVDVTFHLQRPKSVSAKTRPHPTVKPDTSNLVKTIEDAANALLWHDDAQIVKLTSRKIYSDRVGIELQVTVVE